MSRAALVPLAPGFEEIEAVTIVDVLRRAGVRVVTASLGDLQVEGSHGIAVRADGSLDAVLSTNERFDAVVLPGGMPGAARLRDDPRVRTLLASAAARGAVTAAICAAPIALEAAGLLAGKRVTAYPSFRDQLVSAAERCEADVVEDGAVVTGSGPGAALAFSLALVARLVSPEVAQRLAASMGRDYSSSSATRNSRA